MSYTVVIREGNEGGYVATVPALPGCVAQGRTRRQRLHNVKEAMEAYIEALLEDGLPVPVHGRRGIGRRAGVRAVNRLPGGLWSRRVVGTRERAAFMRQGQKLLSFGLSRVDL